MSDAWPTEGGVVHVLAVWRPESWLPAEAGRVIRIGPTSPESRTDAFLLDLARARADRLLTSGAILRAEPGLRHDAPMLPGAAQGLARWRRDVLGRTARPRPAILTRGRVVDWSHPSLQPGASLLTDRESARALESGGRRSDVEIVALDPAGPREAVAALRARDMERAEAVAITVELGANASRPLYETPVVVDELWLATYLEEDLCESARGTGFLDPGRIREIFGAPVTRRVCDESSGRWSFERFRARDPVRASC